jgi:hypothetical protein
VRPVSVAVRSRFHTVLAVALAGLVFAGFARSYYLRPLLGGAPSTVLVHLHAASFTGWLALFTVQAWLIASGRVRHHMRLGRAGAVLAVATIALSFVTVLDAAGSGRGRGGLSAVQQMAIPLTGLGLFAGFVGAGLVLRRRRDLHGRLMTLGLLGALGPAIGRLSPGLTAQLAVLAAVLACLFRHDYRSTGRVHPVYLIGGAALAASWPLRYVVARTDAWAAFAGWLIAWAAPA